MSEEPAPRHSWHEDVRRIAAADTDSGNGETVRTCALCKLIMVTVHPTYGTPWHEFTMPGCEGRIKLSQRPPCIPKGEPIELKTESVSG
jgi:hypothetical protein